jgi:hypothetical protein
LQAGDSFRDADADDEQPEAPREEGPVHRTLIRAQLPRLEGQPPAPRPAPDFTIRQPGAGRPGRFRPRGPQRGGGGSSPFQGNRSFTNQSTRSNGNFAGGGRGGNTARPQGPGGGNRQGGRRHGGGPNRNKRSK